MYGYGSEYKAQEAPTLHVIDGEEQPVYKIGKYNVRVSFLKREIYVSEPERRYGSSSNGISQSINLYDGVLSVDFSFIVDEVLGKSDPVEVARCMLANEDVRTMVIEALAERWSQDNITDTERRRFLHAVAAQTNDKAVDILADTMRKWEYAFDKRSYVSHTIRNANDVLRSLDVKIQGAARKNQETGEWEKSEPVLLQLRDVDAMDVDEEGKTIPGRGSLAIGGKAWDEAREYWRDEIGKLFPPPLAPMPLKYDPLIGIDTQLQRLYDEGGGAGEFVKVRQKDLDEVLAAIKKHRAECLGELDIMVMQSSPAEPATFGGIDPDAGIAYDLPEKPKTAEDDIPF